MNWLYMVFVVLLLSTCKNLDCMKVADCGCCAHKVRDEGCIACCCGHRVAGAPWEASLGAVYEDTNGC